MFIPRGGGGRRLPIAAVWLYAPVLQSEACGSRTVGMLAPSFSFAFSWPFCQRGLRGRSGPPESKENQRKCLPGQAVPDSDPTSTARVRAPTVRKIGGRLRVMTTFYLDIYQRASTSSRTSPLPFPRSSAPPRPLGFAAFLACDGRQGKGHDGQAVPLAALANGDGHLPYCWHS